MDVKEALPLVNAVLKEVSKVIVGKQSVLEGFLICLLANGQLLIEDYPGLAKTLIAKTFAQTLGCKFGRVQFTPDLLPADVTGSYIYNQKSSVFELRRGPIFCNILLADEINRAPPKTQSSILEAMEERQVTIEGDTQQLDQPFFVVATQNPIEFEGTYPLPEAQIDRFMMKLPVGYPDTIEDEIEILNRRRERGIDQSEVKTILDAKTLVNPTSRIVSTRSSWI